MASTVDQYIEALCPSLYAATTLDIYKEIATASTDATLFGEQYNYAVALRASHNYTIDKTRANGTGGYVTNLTEGRTSTSFWNDVGKDRSGLSLTTYGQRLKALIRSMGISVSIGVEGVL